MADITMCTDKTCPNAPKPEDIVVRPASVDPAHPWIRAHEVGAIIKAAMDVAFAAGQGFNRDALEAAWLAKADELEKME